MVDLGETAAVKHEASAVGVASRGLEDALPSRRRLMPVAMAALFLALLALAAYATGRIAANRAEASLRDRAMAALPLAIGTLTGEVDKQRLIPIVLSRDGAVQGLLQVPTPGAEARLDDKLRHIAEEAAASVIYVVRADGIAVAASNAGEPTSFVGNDYRFRHYFQDAMANGSASQYALGTVSARPGLYLSRRVDGANGPLGVVVVKVELDRVEGSWRESGYIVFATDDLGVVLATSVPEWRFGTLAPLTDVEAEAARDRLQLPEAAFGPV